MLKGLNITHLKKGILSLVEGFDFKLLVKDEHALKTAVEKQYSDAENQAVFAHDSALTEAFGLSTEEGSEASFQDLMEAHLDEVQGNVDMLCEALSEVGIQLNSNELPEKAQLVETLNNKISLKARSKLSKQGHGKPIGDTPKANASTGSDGSLTEQYHAIKDPAKRAAFRAKNLAKLRAEAEA